MTGQRAPESPRQELETAFTPVLRGVWDALPATLAIAFVDQEGECIDYVSSLDPFDAKVSAAHGAMLLDRLRDREEKLGLRLPYCLHVAASERSLWVRRVSDDHQLVLVSVGDSDPGVVWLQLAQAAHSLRTEAGLDAPTWEPRARVQVALRSAVGWPFAPASFVENDVSVAVSDVLGRWIEAGEERLDGELTCFRVRTADGKELTLVHDAAQQAWQVRR